MTVLTSEQLIRFDGAYLIFRDCSTSNFGQVLPAPAYPLTIGGVISQIDP